MREAAGLVAALMSGAVAMHLNVGNPLRKAIPAALMLAPGAAIVALRWSRGPREAGRITATHTRPCEGRPISAIL